MLRRHGEKYAVSSDKGFTVDRSGSPLTQFVLRYSESDHILEYPLENLVPGSVTVICAAEIERWLPPFSSERLSEQKKGEIAERIASALRFLGDLAEAR